MYIINRNETDCQGCINWRIFILIALLILLSYSNSFHATFHFDDFHNITQNTKLHIDSLSPEVLVDVISASFEKDSKEGWMLYRPVSYVSFAINWYFGQNNVTGYHVVNVAIHVLTAFLLYLTILALFDSPNLAGGKKEDDYFIAALAACLWALNPIQTQAVTYIVQRMASMAAMFYILGMYCYVKSRISQSLTNKILLLTGCCLSFLLAVGSKENAFLLPVSILLVEIIFFQDLTDSGTRKKFVWYGIAIFSFVFVSGVFLFISGDVFGRIIGGYENRTFSLSERLLTQPRIIVFYITQIFYPIADRLSLDHDIVVSTNLFSPWTTLPSILFILFLIVAAFHQIIKRPVFSFAILFFLVNHSVESSIIPLELLFEHRNYLPSLFLFLPFAAGIKWLINNYSKEKKMMEGLLIGFVSLLIGMFGFGTYVRNMAWVDEKTLWEDTMEKAPGRARAYQNLASTYYAKIKDHDKIMELCKEALYLKDSTRNKAIIVSLANIAQVYADQKNHLKVIEVNNRILTIDPENLSAKYKLSLALIETGQLETAQKHLRELLSKKPNSVEYLNTMALILLKQKKPEKAIKHLITAIQSGRDDERTFLSLGVAKSLLGQFTQAENYFSRIPNRSERKMLAQLLLIENCIKSGHIQKAENQAETLVSMFGTAKIFGALDSLSMAGLQWPVATDLIAPMIAEKLVDQSSRILELGKKDGG
jgi:protein O-mannosyl-transferase